ncbi:hypothetical protein [Pseudofulvimonas gallinarii]|uniref:hypothetical protein n=1 Tax=Pseudofulvimonas gallinarii TaxID=634155 RepID=UPI000F499E3E|nr:hypothetical protein [Pseudofulvimonas gallinarii]THD13922.1 hypothetical protein B1808_05390 [Pseudofulvimonas gallinarii]
MLAPALLLATATSAPARDPSTLAHAPGLTASLAITSRVTGAQTSQESDMSQPSQPRPWEVQELHDHLFGWTGKEVVVAGYPMLFFDNDPLERTVRLHIEPGKSDTQPGLLQGNMAAPDAEPLSRNRVILVRGRITGTVADHVEMEDCQRIGDADGLPPPAPQPLQADSLPATTPVRVDDLQAAMRGLIGQEVTVRGYFNGWTTSQVDSGTIHHIELQDTATHRKGVFVQLRAAPGEDLAVPDRVHLVRGRVDGALGQQVRLVDAEIVASDV